MGYLDIELTASRVTVMWAWSTGDSRFCRTARDPFCRPTRSLFHVENYVNRNTGIQDRDVKYLELIASAEEVMLSSDDVCVCLCVCM